MADPITLALIGATVLGAAGTIMETQGAKAEAEAEGKVAAANAEAAAAQAGQAEDAQRRRNREFLARQRAAIGEANIGQGGSAGLLQEQTAAELELEALNIRYGGELRRQGFVAEERMAKARKKQIGKTGFLRAASQLLSGGAQSYGAYQNRPRAT